MMKAEQLLYEGKAKSIYASDNPDSVYCVFRDDTSAFDGVKKAKLAGKGCINNRFNAAIMTLLAKEGIPNHFIKQVDETTSLVKHLKMLPVECVVRNVAAGGLCKRLGIEKGQTLTPPTFEFFLKDDALHDPMINESLMITLGWANQQQIEVMKNLTLKVNRVLKSYFEQAGLVLVDYKLEFGEFNGELMLGDEFTPDGCRIWDSKTQEPLDKDRFRQDLGDVVASYQLVADRLRIS